MEPSTVSLFEDRCVPEPNSGCWLWLGALSDGRYGAVWYEGKLRKAHRVSYSLFIGPVADSVRVLHKCDNPLCVNPSHLFIGTQKENMVDKVNKGRQYRAERDSHHRTKLSSEDVENIRKEYIKGKYGNTKRLAEKYNVNRNTILYAMREQMTTNGNHQPQYENYNDFDDYQEWAKTTAIYPEAGDCTVTSLAYVISGLTNEAGEVSGKFKKLLRDGFTTERFEQIKAELGDVLWYCAALATELGVNLSEIAASNQEKLNDRLARNVIRGDGDSR